MMRISLGIAAAAALGVTCLGRVGLAQEFKPKPPTAADWAALGRLPDFNGVWEAGGGGRGGGGAPPPAGAAGGARAGAAGAPGGRAAGGPGAGAPAGAGGRGRAGAPAGPALTPEYAARKKALQDAG